MSTRYVVVGAVNRSYVDNDTGAEKSFAALNVLTFTPGDGEAGYQSDSLRVPEPIAIEFMHAIAKGGPCVAELDVAMVKMGKGYFPRVSGAKMVSHKFQLTPAGVQLA